MKTKYTQETCPINSRWFDQGGGCGGKHICNECETGSRIIALKNYWEERKDPISLKTKDYVYDCLTTQDGIKIFNKLKPLLKDNRKVDLYFIGISCVTEQFVDNAFVKLLEYFSYDKIKAYLTVYDTNNQIEKIIKGRMNSEVIKLEKVNSFMI